MFPTRMGESGLVFLIIPLVYVVAFPAALLLSAILAFFRKTSFLSSSLFAGALISILGFAFSLGYLFLFGRYFQGISQRFNTTGVPQWLGYVCFSSPFWMALLYLLGSYAAGFYFVFRKRQKQRIDEHTRSLPREAAIKFREGSFS